MGSFRLSVFGFDVIFVELYGWEEIARFRKIANFVTRFFTVYM